jgi:DnaJ-class molecular chaperone
MSSFKPTAMAKKAQAGLQSDVYKFVRCSKCNHKHAIINGKVEPCPECNGKGKPDTK